MGDNNTLIHFLPFFEGDALSSEVLTDKRYNITGHVPGIVHSETIYLSVALQTVTCKVKLIELNICKHFNPSGHGILSKHCLNVIKNFIIKRIGRVGLGALLSVSSVYACK